MPRRCESCGRFVTNHHLRTARYFYDIDHAKPVKVWSLATATVLQERLDCPACSMDCCRMRESQRDHGVASLPDGWIQCAQSSTPDHVVPAGHEAAYPDLAHAIAHAGPDETTEDADGFVTWDGRSPNAMDSAYREES